MAAAMFGKPFVDFDIEILGEEGTKALCDFIESQKPIKGTVGHTPYSIMGVTPAKPTLAVPKEMKPFELRLLCAEFHANTFLEGVGAAMGASNKADNTTSLNRRGAAVAGSWYPLIWAAKDNNLMIAERLIGSGYNVDQQEEMNDKTQNGYAAIHWAAQKGHSKMLSLLIESGASVTLTDKHGNTPLQLAEKKGHKEVISMLEKHKPTAGDKAQKAKAAKAESKGDK